VCGASQRRASTDGGPSDPGLGDAPDDPGGGQQLPSLGYSFYQMMATRGWECEDLSRSGAVREILEEMGGRLDPAEPGQVAPVLRGSPFVVQMTRATRCVERETSEVCDDANDDSTIA